MLRKCADGPNLQAEDQAVKRIAVTAAACAALACIGTGCEKRAEVEFSATDPVLDWPNLDLPDTLDLEDDYTLLVTEPTTGLFPAAVAVARVRADYLGDDPEATRLKMNTEPEAELLPWNSLLDDQRAVSSVFPVKPIALQGEDVTVKHLLRTASAMRASLCLVYATADLSENESEVRGALFDTEDLRPLAVLHARARIDDLDTALAELPEPAPWNPEYFHAAKDPRYHDPPGMAIYKFESMVRKCVVTLREGDTPFENLPTDGWVPERPPDALLWPPQTRQP